MLGLIETIEKGGTCGISYLLNLEHFEGCSKKNDSVTFAISY